MVPSYCHIFILFFFMHSNCLNGPRQQPGGTPADKYLFCCYFLQLNVFTSKEFTGNNDIFPAEVAPAYDGAVFSISPLSVLKFIKQ